RARFAAAADVLVRARSAVGRPASARARAGQLAAHRPAASRRRHARAQLSDALLAGVPDRARAVRSATGADRVEAGILGLNRAAGARAALSVRAARTRPLARLARLSPGARLQLSFRLRRLLRGAATR